jgi:hypothetical protein
VVFDPLGETVRSLRSELPVGDRARCVWIAPEETAQGLNALDGLYGGPDSDPVHAERRLNDVVHALRRVRSGRYADSGYWGPRLEEMVMRALRAAATLPGGTLREAHTLLETSTRLSRPAPPEAMEPIRELADRIRARSEDADGARRLLHEVTRSPVLVRMLCATNSPLRARDLVAPGRIVLISGDAARVGESTARYLLAVLLAVVWTELLARPGNPKTFVLLDEAQWFSHESLAEMLRLGRRKNVHVVLATQAIASLPEPVAEAVWTNVADLVAFRGSPEEAREIARIAPAISADAILSLGRGDAVALLGKGEIVHWIRAARLPAASAGGPPRGSESSRPPGDGSPSPPGDPESSIDLDGGHERRPDGSRVDLDDLYQELARLSAASPGEGTLRVDVAALRQRCDPGGGRVRLLGSRLAAGQVLARIERTPSGRCWVLDRAQLAGALNRPVGDPHDRLVSVPPQPS